MIKVHGLPGQNRVDSSWLWAALAERADPALAFAGPHKCWWCTVSALWSPEAQTDGCDCGWHSETDAATRQLCRKHFYGLTYTEKSIKKSIKSSKPSLFNKCKTVSNGTF